MFEIRTNNNALLLDNQLCMLHCNKYQNLMNQVLSNRTRFNSINESMKPTKYFCFQISKNLGNAVIIDNACTTSITKFTQSSWITERTQLTSSNLTKKKTKPLNKHQFDFKMKRTSSPTKQSSATVSHNVIGASAGQAFGRIHS